MQFGKTRGRVVLPLAPPQWKQHKPEATVNDRSRQCLLHDSRTDLSNLLSIEKKKLAEELHKHCPFPRVMAMQNAENSNTPKPSGPFSFA